MKTRILISLISFLTMMMTTASFAQEAPISGTIIKNGSAVIDTVTNTATVTWALPRLLVNCGTLNVQLDATQLSGTTGGNVYVDVRNHSSGEWEDVASGTLINGTVMLDSLETFGVEYRLRVVGSGTHSTRIKGYYYFYPQIQQPTWNQYWRRDALTDSPDTLTNADTIDYEIPLSSYAKNYSLTTHADSLSGTYGVNLLHQVKLHPDAEWFTISTTALTKFVTYNITGISVYPYHRFRWITGGTQTTKLQSSFAMKNRKYYDPSLINKT